MKKAKDAKRTLTVHITPGDIRTAGLGRGRKAPNHCAAAQAIKREYKCKDAEVHLSRTYVQDASGTWTRYATPKALRDEIIAFDRGGTFEPSTFDLGVMKPYMKDSGARGYVRKPAHKRRKVHVTASVRPRAVSAR